MGYRWYSKRGAGTVDAALPGGTRTVLKPTGKVVTKMIGGKLYYVAETTRA